jgi:ribosomal protein S8
MKLGVIAFLMISSFVFASSFSQDTELLVKNLVTSLNGQNFTSGMVDSNVILEKIVNASYNPYSDYANPVYNSFSDILNANKIRLDCFDIFNLKELLIEKILDAMFTEKYLTEYGNYNGWLIKGAQFENLKQMNPDYSKLVITYSNIFVSRAGNRVGLIYSMFPAAPSGAFGVNQQICIVDMNKED